MEAVAYLGSSIVWFNIKDLGLKYYTKVACLLGCGNAVHVKGHLCKSCSRLTWKVGSTVVNALCMLPKLY